MREPPSLHSQIHYKRCIRNSIFFAPGIAQNIKNPLGEERMLGDEKKNFSLRTQRTPRRAPRDNISLKISAFSAPLP